MIFQKLNDILNKSTNLYVRFFITFFFVLIPFNCIAILILIAIQNPLRAFVLLLCLIASLFESTRENKFILGFIGIIPMGFYIATSPIALGWIFGNVAKDLFGVLYSNPITTLISGISIYGIIKSLKGASSIYEWFANSGFSGYFFPEYKNLKDKIGLKDQIINKLIKENNILTTSLIKAKTALQQLQVTATDTFKLMEEKLDKEQENKLMDQNQPLKSTNDIMLPVENNLSIPQLHDNLAEVIQNTHTTINDIDNQINQNQQNTKEIIKIQEQQDQQN